MTDFFQNRDDISDLDPLRVSPHVVKGVSALVDQGSDVVYGALRESLVISCTYWVLNISDSRHVVYHREQAPAIDATPKGQQGATFIGLAYLIGLVKEPTKENGVACTKRWAAGLAGVQKNNLLSEIFMTTVWQVLVDKKADYYKRAHVRTDVMTKYLSLRTSESTEPPLVRAVLSQLELVYTNAYLKSVNLMNLFSTSGSRALEIPSVTQEAMMLDSALTKVKALEGLNYETCRLLDNNKYPELNHAHYPNLYAATLEWARRGKKVQKNYQGSKSLIDQAVHLDIVRKVLRFSTASMGTASLTQEQQDWLESRGYRIPDTPLSDLLKTGTKRGDREAHASDSSSESESEDETDAKRKRRRRH